MTRPQASGPTGSQASGTTGSQASGGRKPPGLPCACLLLAALTTPFADAAEPLKVICATRAVAPPKIDGVLDDACWQQTEVRSDFTSPASGMPIKRRTTMRFVYDDTHLYMGVEFHWDDAAALRQGVAGIVKKHGPVPKGVLDFRKYVNCYGFELFIDPGATQVNYYQILLNAAGQYAGNYKMMWHEFKGGQTFAHTIRGNCWTVEFVYPYKGIGAGDEWGLNLCRNDETYYGIWKQVGGAYHAPKMFGRIVMGSYAQWWQAVWGRGAATRLAQIGKRLQRHAGPYPSLRTLFRIVRDRARHVEAVAKRHALTSRHNFEVLYRAYTDFRSDFHRLSSFWETLELMGTKP